MTPFELSVLLFLQFAVILVACRLVGFLVRPLGQPQVVAEMITGVLLGPSLLGWLLPGLHARLFPPESLPIIYCLAQIGLVLYMFLVGLDFDLDLIRTRVRSAVAVSWAGILVPFALGALLAVALGKRYQLFAPTAKTWEMALFFGSAMSITAFPMLARIIRERGLTGTSLGTLALAAGSLDDAAAWCLLALVLSSFTGNLSIALFAVGGGAVFAVVLLVVGRPLFARLFGGLEHTERRRELILPAALVLLMLAAFTTDAIGVYAVFGAFLFGAAMPRGVLQKRLAHQIEPLATTYLLPMFFVNSGLNTRIGLLGSASLIGITLLVLGAAVAGKGLACAVAARLAGEPWRSAVAIGSLMNARGLMELILLNIGLERGVITHTFFTIMVLMAVVTTLMAVPVFNTLKLRSLSAA